MSQDDAIEQRANRGLTGRWYVVAKSADLRQNEPLAVRALDRKLVLWRSPDGTPHCLEDRCPHRGAPLSCGHVNGDHIACRYHGVTLDGGGVIVKVPALGKSGLEGRKALDHYSVRESCDGVFVYFPSAAALEPTPLQIPDELTDPQRSSFLCTALWEANYRYILDNLVDPMHGIYLHGDTFTLAQGLTSDRIEIESTTQGFIVQRAAQRGVNFDWVEMVTESGFMHARVIIPYPPAGGPGGHMTIIASVTPVDALHSRIFFWRTRKVSGLEREIWRFLFRTTFEARHFYVLEQDRTMLAALPDAARNRELLYQHDGGVARIRKVLAQHAQRELDAEKRSPLPATSH